MGSTMQINTTEMKNICSTFNSKVSSIDLGSVDVAGSFEPFTSQGILTGYVSSLKDALTSISENCTNIMVKMQLIQTYLVITQMEITLEVEPVEVVEELTALEQIMEEVQLDLQVVQLKLQNYHQLLQHLL